MNEKILFQYGTWIILIALLLTGCNTNKPKFEVTNDGKGCTVSGPTELPPGEHTFTFIDKSEWKGELYLSYLESGKTFQDNLELQSEPGEWYPKPPWVQYDIDISHKSQELDEKRVDTDIWRLDKVGEHTILCYVDDPRHLWFAAPIMIVEENNE